MKIDQYLVNASNEALQADRHKRRAFCKQRKNHAPYTCR